MKKSRFIYGWLLFVCFLNVKYAEPAEAQVSAEDEFEDYLSSIEADFYNFEDSINRNFADYLEQAWQEFTVYEGAASLCRWPIFYRNDRDYFGTPP